MRFNCFLGEVYVLSTDNPQIENPGGRIYRIVDPERYTIFANT